MSELNLGEQLVREALRQFAVSVAIPVLYDDPKGVDQVGTGTLFTLADRYFLITAGHLFERRDAGRFAIPKGRINAPLHSLGPYNFYRTNEAEFDIAILELKEEFTISYAKAGWRVLNLENVGRASAVVGEFVLCGYPSQRAWRTDSEIGGDPFTIFTQQMPDIPPEADCPVHPALDLFFFYPAKAPTLTGKITEVPHLRGASGASIWEYIEQAGGGGLWSPDKVLKAIGVQSSCREGRYFRVKSWAAVLKMLRQADATLAPLIDEYTGRVWGQVFN